MARGKKRRAEKKPKPQKSVTDAVCPTPERKRFNRFRSQGLASRAVPSIEILYEDGVLTDGEFGALWYYRDQALLSDKSPTKSCIDFSVGGGNGPGVAIVSASIETTKLERMMGGLRPIARAVAVEDYSLDRWCYEKHGSVSPSQEERLVMDAVADLKAAANKIYAARA